jgi:TRPM family ion channel/conflict system pore-forming effector with SLATT domain/uncharacterized protein DUF4231
MQWLLGTLSGLSARRIRRVPMSSIEKKSIPLRRDHPAVAVFPSADSKAEEIVTALGVEKAYKAVILVLGSAADLDQKLIPRLTQLFGRGIARAAAETKSVVLDGGTQAGVMALIGEGVAGRGYSTTLIGVAPASKVSYPGGPEPGDGRVPLEPNHTHFVLVEGNDWGSETATLFSLAGALMIKTVETRKARLWRKPETAIERVPGLIVLAGGGAVTREEALRAVRQQLPLIVIEGSGGLADEIAAAWRQKETLPDDPVMAEILADGEIHLHLLSNSVKGIERLIIRELGVDKALMQAWEVFSDYDHNAILQKERFSRLQLAILILGVIGTGLAVLQQVYAPKDGNQLRPVSWTPGIRHWWLIHYALIALPILLTVLVTAANRFKQGSKWLLLRAGAESIKREIYRYRAKIKDYQENPEQLLSKRVEDITQRTMRTEVNLSGLLLYDRNKGFPPWMDAAKGGDDGFSILTPDHYVELRLGDQMRYYRKNSLKYDRQLRRLSWLTFIIGGAGTYLAAVNQQAWIALTTAMVAALGTYLAYRQTENTLTKYNQAATDLANVKAWWSALSAEEQSQQVNIDSLVEHTEQVLQSEFDGWIQQMQNSLAELRKGQAAPPEREEGGEPHEAPPPAGAGRGSAAGGAGGKTPPPVSAGGDGNAIPPHGPAAEHDEGDAA